MVGTELASRFRAAVPRRLQTEGQQKLEPFGAPSGFTAEDASQALEAGAQECGGERHCMLRGHPGLWCHAP